MPSAKKKMSIIKISSIPLVKYNYEYIKRHTKKTKEHPKVLFIIDAEDIQRVNKKIFDLPNVHKVNLKGTVLKPNMILPGADCKEKASTDNIAKKTLECLKKNVPSEVPGVAFLSGGQSEVEATKNLNAINKINNTSFHFTFSYGRALQQSALKTWAKSMKDIDKIQKAFNHRAKMNGASTEAKWSEKLEQTFAA